MRQLNVVIIGLISLFLVLSFSKSRQKGTVHYFDYTYMGGYKFKTNPDTSRWIRLIPNKENRNKRKISKIDSVYGVHHFFLDHDLTNGFVHQYTHNFFKWLLPEQYVMYYSPSNYDREKGKIKFIQKKQLTSQDTLGRQFAFFRQWKLSEIELDKGKVKLKKCGFNSYCGCPQIKPEAKTPYKKEFPLGVWDRKDGKFKLKDLSALNKVSGGTVLFIWEQNNKVWFSDYHGSLKDIFEEAQTISKKHNVDPTIAVGDAGPFCRKIKADIKNILNTRRLDGISRGAKFGAGFGYMVRK